MRSIKYIIIDYYKKLINIDKKTLQIVGKKDRLICGKKEDGKYEEKNNKHSSNSSC